MEKIFQKDASEKRQSGQGPDDVRTALDSLYSRMFEERKRNNPAALELEYWKDHFVTETLRSLREIHGSILDIGCGTGEIDIWLARAKTDARITGVDACSDALAHAERHLSRESGAIRERVTFVPSLIEHLPFGDSTFDCCFCSHTIEHVRHHHALFAELYRVLKPGGAVVVFVPFDHFHDDPTHIWHFNEETLERLLRLFSDSVTVWKSPDGRQMAGKLSLRKKPKIIGMLRIKNEERWIVQTLEKASPVVDGFVILDDGSTDRTPQLGRSHPKVLRYEYQQEAVTDEARDKNRLLQWALDEHPDWILALGGDELLEDAAPAILRRELEMCPWGVTALGFNFLYMWDSHERYRVDGKYNNLRHPRLFRVTGPGIDPRTLRFRKTTHGANFHCGSIPANLPGAVRYIDLNVKHYGYFERAQREQKKAFYERLDPVNAGMGYYDHLTNEEGIVLHPWRERGALSARPAEYRRPASALPANPAPPAPACPSIGMSTDIPAYYRHARPEIAAEVPANAVRILDLGCAAGALGKFLKQQSAGRHVTGIEINREVAAHARRNIDRVYCADVELFDPPFATGEFDCIIFADVLEHLIDPWGTLKRYARFLRPSGTLIASIPNVRRLTILHQLADLGSWKYQDEGILDRTHLRFFTRDEFLRLLRESGIRCDAVRNLRGEGLREYAPAGPRRAVRIGRLIIEEVSKEEFEELSALQFLFVGTFCPTEGEAGGAELREGWAEGLVFNVIGKQKVLPVINNRDLLVKLQAGPKDTKIPSNDEEIDAVDHVYQDIYRGKFGNKIMAEAEEVTDTNNNQFASIIIPVYNNWEYTRQCLLSLDAESYRQKAEVIVVDNASTDATATRLKSEFPWVEVIRNEQNLGFAKACNRGAETARGKYLVFLNNDTKVQKGWLEALIAAYEGEPGTGIVGSKLLYPDGRLQHAGMQIVYPGAASPIHAAHLRYRQPDAPDARREVDAIAGAAMLVPRAVFYELRGFEEVYQNGFEDVDFCLKARAGGYRILYEPASRAIHYESKTRGRFANEIKNINILHRRWLPYVLQHFRKATCLQETQPSNRPPVSVIIVTYNSLVTIAACMESVLATTTGADEIIVVDNNSRDETSYYLECLQKVFPVGRVQLHCETANMGYAGAAARGADIASREIFVFLNPNTVVFPGWLEGLAQPLAQGEGRIAATGPVSNYAAGRQNVIHYAERDYLQKETVAANIARTLGEQQRGKVVPTDLLIRFCLAVKRKIYAEVGGIDADLFLGNDDLDFSWRLAQAGYRQVVVPAVFVYHQGQKSFQTEPAPKTTYLVQQSTNQLYEKIYASYAGKPPDGKSLWDIEWFSPQQELLSIIMPVYKTSAVTSKALEAIGKWTARPLEVIIIDNGNDPAMGDLVNNLPEDLRHRVTLITNEENVGYPRACNQGLAMARGEYLVIMNNDVLVTPYWAARLLAAFSVDQTVGIVGPYTNFAAGVQGVQGRNYNEDSLATWARQWHQKNAGNLKEVGRLIGFLWMIKRKVVEDIGGLDPLYGIGNFEDDDYCLRAQLSGYKLALAEDVFVHHYGSQSFKKNPQAYNDILQTNRMLFAAKWGINMQGSSYSIEEVIRRGLEGYNPGYIYIPLRLEAIFSPGAAPLDVGARSRTGVLCIPDPSDQERRWLDVVKGYLRRYRPDAGLALIVRVEPNSKEWLNQVVSAIQQMALKEKIDLEREDIIIEARPIPSSHRGSLYRAARYFVPLPGVRREALLREARLSGLQVIEPEA